LLSGIFMNRVTLSTALKWRHKHVKREHEYFGIVQNYEIRYMSPAKPSGRSACD